MNPGDTKLKPPGEPSGAAGRLLLGSTFLFDVQPPLQIQVFGAITKGRFTPIDIFSKIFAGLLVPVPQILLGALRAPNFTYFSVKLR